MSKTTKTKKCRVCGEVKPEAEFYFELRSGRHKSECRRCNTAGSLASRRKYLPRKFAPERYVCLRAQAPGVTDKTMFRNKARFSAFCEASNDDRLTVMVAAMERGHCKVCPVRAWIEVGEYPENIGFLEE